jgi:recombination protein RecA
MNITETVKELHNKGLTNLEISQQANFTRKQILSVLQKNKLSSNRYKILVEDNQLKQFIIGSVLGDGCISKTDKASFQSKITFGHCEKQLPYLTWKNNLLKQYALNATKIGKYTYMSIRYKSGECTTFTFKSKSHPYFSNLRTLFYPNGIKNIKQDLIKEMDALGLAIWFMDDGCICKRSYQIYTNSFTLEEVEFLQDVLKNNFNINSTIDKNRVIYIRTDSKELFKEIIKPYIVPCMLYKLRGSV